MNREKHRIVDLKPLILVAAIAIVLGCGDASSRLPQNQMIPAILRDDVAKVEKLLDDTGNVDINWKSDGIGVNALGTAAAHNRVAIVQLLLRRGAHADLANNNGETPLQSAAYHGNVEVVRILINAGANVNASDTLYRYTPLADAARRGHADIIELLLDAGADRDAKIKDGRTAIQLAEQFGHADAAIVLLTYRRRAADDEVGSAENPGNATAP